MQLVSQKPLSLLRRSGLIALVLFAAVWLAACTNTAPAPAGEAPAAEATEAPAEEAAAEDAPATEVTRENTLIFAGDASDLLTLDPAVAYEFGGIQVVGSVYETLVSFIPGESGIQPLLADSWEIEDTGETWTLTFALNPD